MPPSQPLVSIVVPTLNAGSEFSGLLEALGAQKIPGELELVVVDSGSGDGSAERARSAGAQVLSVTKRQFSHGQTRNLAVQASSGQFVALTVQDAMPTSPDWLRQLLDPMLGSPEVAGSYGLQVAPPGASLLARTRSSLWHQQHRLPAVKTLADKAAFLGLSPADRMELVRFDNVTSCLRRSVWEKHAFPVRDYAEDMGWAKEVLLAGHHIAYVPGAQVWHAHERSWLYELRRAYVHGRARVALVGWPSTTIGVTEVVALLKRLFFFLTTKRFDAVAEVEEARRFFIQERRRYEPLADETPVRVWLDTLSFAWGLTDHAARLSREGSFPEGAWIRLLRFALVVTTGHALGTAETASGDAESPVERGCWRLLHRCLHTGV
jgi:rhamnosyltransferase